MYDIQNSNLLEFKKKSNFSKKNAKVLEKTLIFEKEDNF